MKMIFAVCLMMVFHYAGAFNVTDCGSVSGTFKSVSVSGCTTDDADERCGLPILGNITVTIEFDSKIDTDSVTAIATSLIDDVQWQSSYYAYSDACAYGGLSCPLKNGDPYTYAQSIPVAYSPLGVDLHVKWELKDKDSNDIICIEIPSVTAIA